MASFSEDPAQVVPRSLLADFEAVSDYPGQPDAAPLMPRARSVPEPSRPSRVVVAGMLAVGLVAVGGVVALQARNAFHRKGKAALVHKPEQLAEVSCNTATPGDKCFEHLNWAMEHGIFEHPEWYEGLTPNSRADAFQQALFDRGMGGCMKPCTESDDEDSTASTTLMTRSDSHSSSSKVSGHLRLADGTAAGHSSKRKSLQAAHAKRSLPKHSPKPPAPTTQPTPAPSSASTSSKSENRSRDNRTTDAKAQSNASTTDASAEKAGRPSKPPANCHDASPGDQCHGQVLWAMQTGILSNPEWYPGLSVDSTFQDFQAFLSAEGRDNCKPPCTASGWDGLPADSAAAKSRQKKAVDTDTQAQIAAGLADGPTLFCWMLFAAHSYESGLVQLQLSKEYGIFACDARAVFSDFATTLSDGTRTTPIGQMDSRPSDWGSVLNTAPFAKAWAIIAEDGSFNDYDWTVKADADSVWFPERLRLNLVDKPKGKAIWVQNSIGNTPLLGPLEVFSKEAVKLYAEKGKSCVRPEVVNSTGEDGFISMCMGEIGAESVMDLTQLRNSPNVEDCATHWNVVYHPHKDVGNYIACVLATSGHQYEK